MLSILASPTFPALTFPNSHTNTNTTKCDWNPATVANDTTTLSDDEIDQLPIYTSEDVSNHDGSGEVGTDSHRMWMSYGGYVYDVTDFIHNHPGGIEKISTAAGQALEPFWFLYRQHYASDLPLKLMEHLVIGKLVDTDQEKIDEQMAILEEDDPYAREPIRHRSLLIHSDTPMNAETPAPILTQSYITPSSLFYIRHHHPVPHITPQQVLHQSSQPNEHYYLTVDLSAYGGPIKKYTLEDLQTKFKPVSVTATLQCSGNRRGGYNDHQRTSGTAWGQGAISTAIWHGVRLTDLLRDAGLHDPIQACEEYGMEHVRFHSLDGMSASIGIEKATNPYGDCILAYRMNDESSLPRDHGYPLRAIVPGYAAVRNVKWLTKIEISKEEAEGPWQRGLNYKTLPPSITDAQNINLDEMPSMTEVSLFSGITDVKIIGDQRQHAVGDVVTISAKGWAWAGGGRNIVRVDVTGDDGDNWSTATLTEGKQQRFGRAWAWTFWECQIPNCKIRDDGTVSLASKAVDMAFNVQPENAKHSWNVRGLGNNSWYRTSVKLVDVPKKELLL
jgi:sulfite oxidase